MKNSEYWSHRSADHDLIDSFQVNELYSKLSKRDGVHTTLHHLPIIHIPVHLLPLTPVQNRKVPVRTKVTFYECSRKDWTDSLTSRFLVCTNHNNLCRPVIHCSSNPINLDRIIHCEYCSYTKYPVQTLLQGRIQAGIYKQG